MTVPLRVRAGLAGLLGFEALVAATTFSRGSTPFVLMSLVAGAALAVALRRTFGGERPTFALLLVVAGATAVRAGWQTLQGSPPPGLWPTWLVPLGFALAAVAARSAESRLGRLGIVSVALGRSWFAVWYLPFSPTLVVANVLGAAGAWIWATAATTSDERPKAASA